MEVRFAALADVVVALHFCYVAFTVGGEVLIVIGGLLRWGWIRALSFRIAHLAAVVLVAVEASTGTQCPLTVWEYQLRTLAGQRVDGQISFVARVVRSVIFYNFPAWVFLTAYLGFGALVILTIFLVPPRWKRPRKTTMA